MVLSSKYDKKEKETEESLVLDVPQAGRLLNISRATAYKLVAQGIIPSIRLGRRIVVPRAAFQRMLDKADNKTED